MTLGSARRLAQFAVFLFFAVQFTSPSSLTLAAPPESTDEPPTSQDEHDLIYVKSKADVQALVKPLSVWADKLDKEALSMLLDHKTLRNLMIMDCDMSERAIWKKLGNLEELRRLDLVNFNAENTTEWSAFLKELRDSPVERVYLDHVSGVTQEWLFHFADMAQLRELTLPGVARGKATKPPAAPRWQIDTLRFRDMSATPSGLDSLGLDSNWLTFFGKQPELTSLWLSRAELDDAGCKGLASSTTIRSLGLESCSFVDGTVPDSFSFPNGLDRINVIWNLGDEQLAELISMNVSKALVVSGGAKLTGQFFKDVDDWAHLEELAVYAQSESDWNNQHIIDAFPEMLALRKVALQGTKLTSDAVVEAFLACSPEDVTLLDASELSASMVEKLIGASFIESLTIRGLTTITVGDAQALRSRFLKLREGVTGASCYLQVRERD